MQAEAANSQSLNGNIEYAAAAAAAAVFLHLKHNFLMTLVQNESLSAEEN